MPRLSLQRSANTLALLSFVALALAMAAAGPAGAAGRWWKPPQRLTWFWQLQGIVSNEQPVAAYDIDGFETKRRRSPRCTRRAST